MTTTLKLRTLKNVVGTAVTGLHIAAVLIVWIWLQPPRLSTEDFYLTVLILAPVTSIYALAYVREAGGTMIVGNIAPHDDSRIWLRWSVISIVFTLLFTALVMHTLYSFIQGSDWTPKELQIRLAAIEFAVGAFTGFIYETLFGKLPPGTPPQTQG